MSQITPLPAQLQKVANEELGEVPARIPADLQDLKTWIQQQPHLKARTDDQFLVQFLRGSKYSLERAKRKIDQFYSLRTKYPEMYSITDVDEPKFRELHNTGSYVSLPTPLNGSGPRIICWQLNFSPQYFTSNDIFQFAVSWAEVMVMSDPYACINGVVVVLDLAKATPDFVRLLTPSLVKHMVVFFEKTFPIRVKVIYCLNIPKHVEKCLLLVLQLVPEKLRNRILISGSNLDELGEHISKKYLPLEYGGENGSLQELCAAYSKVWDEYREYFKQNAQYGTDERLRPGKPFDSDGELGFGGSFRKINVD